MTFTRYYGWVDRNGVFTFPDSPIPTPTPGTVDTVTMDSAVLIDAVPGFAALFAPIDARLTALGA